MDSACLGVRDEERERGDLGGGELFVIPENNREGGLMTKCRECMRPIPPARLAGPTTARTCSRQCSKARRLRQCANAARRWRLVMRAWRSAPMPEPTAGLCPMCSRTVPLVRRLVRLVGPVCSPACDERARAAQGMIDRASAVWQHRLNRLLDPSHGNR